MAEHPPIPGVQSATDVIGRSVLFGGGALAVSVTVVLIGLGVSCNRNPTRPTPTPAPAATTDRPVALEVTGPAQIAPGESAQFTATGRKADGTSEDFTSQVTWESSDSAVAKVSSTGLVTGLTGGECYVTASYRGLQGQPASILVLPAGTYRLAGQVTDARLGSGVAVPGARVEIVAGIGTGLTALTNPGGNYVLYGVAGSVSVRVTKDGYRTEDEHVAVSESSQSLDVAMTPVKGYQSLAGRYRLTITAGSCLAGVSLPDQLRQRTYLAVLTQKGGILHVTLDDPGTGAFEGFLPGANDFDGFLQPNRVTFRLIGFNSYYYYYSSADLSLVERVSPWWLLMEGAVEADLDHGTISGLLDGEMLVFPVTSSIPPPLGQGCFAHDTRFLMVKE